MHGFSLIEQSIVISLLGIVIITLSEYKKKEDFRYHEIENNRRIKVITEALEIIYLNVISKKEDYYKYLCPDNGKENKLLSKCSANKIFVKNQILYSGDVPVQKLGLPRYYAYGSFGKKFIFNIDIEALINKHSNNIFIQIKAFSATENKYKDYVREYLLTVSSFIRGVNYFKDITDSFCKLWEVSQFKEQDCLSLKKRISALCLK